MARFHGQVGYGETVETRPGVYEDVITEKTYSGDVTSVSRKNQSGPGVLGTIRVQNVISILSDAYGFEHIFALKYIIWQGAYWTVTDVEVKRPRLILRLGEVYNGPTARST